MSNEEVAKQNAAAILDVPVSASKEVIKSAYQSKLLTTHPDKLRSRLTAGLKLTCSIQHRQEGTVNDEEELCQECKTHLDNQLKKLDNDFMQLQKAYYLLSGVEKEQIPSVSWCEPRSVLDLKSRFETEIKCKTNKIEVDNGCAHGRFHLECAEILLNITQEDDSIIWKNILQLIQHNKECPILSFNDFLEESVLMNKERAPCTDKNQQQGDIISLPQNVWSFFANHLLVAYYLNFYRPNQINSLYNQPLSEEKILARNIQHYNEIIHNESVQYFFKKSALSFNEEEKLLFFLSGLMGKIVLDWCQDATEPDAVEQLALVDRKWQAVDEAIEKYREEIEKYENGKIKAANLLDDKSKANDSSGPLARNVYQDHLKELQKRLDFIFNVIFCVTKAENNSYLWNGDKYSNPETLTQAMEFIIKVPQLNICKTLWQAFCLDNPELLKKAIAAMTTAQVNDFCKMVPLSDEEKWLFYEHDLIQKINAEWCAEENEDVLVNLNLRRLKWELVEKAISEYRKNSENFNIEKLIAHLDFIFNVAFCIKPLNGASNVLCQISNYTDYLKKTRVEELYKIFSENLQKVNCDKNKMTNGAIKAKDKCEQLGIAIVEMESEIANAISRIVHKNKDNEYINYSESLYQTFFKKHHELVSAEFIGSKRNKIRYKLKQALGWTLGVILVSTLIGSLVLIPFVVSGKYQGYFFGGTTTQKAVKKAGKEIERTSRRFFPDNQNGRQTCAAAAKNDSGLHSK